MSRRKLTSKDKRKQARAGKRMGLVTVIPFDRENGKGTISHSIECEQCGRRYIGGEGSPMKDRACVCGHLYARYVA